MERNWGLADVCERFSCLMNIISTGCYHQVPFKEKELVLVDGAYDERDFKKKKRINEDKFVFSSVSSLVCSENNAFCLDSVKFNSTQPNFSGC